MECFESAINDNLHELNRRKLLVVIFTDGQPTSPNMDSYGAVKQFKNALRYRKSIKKVHVTIVACTDDDFAMQYLNLWDETIKNLDIVDDYESEKREVYMANPRNYAFSYGDYITKILLGSLICKIDYSDESPICCNVL